MTLSLEISLLWWKWGSVALLVGMWAWVVVEAMRWYGRKRFHEGREKGVLEGVSLGHHEGWKNQGRRCAQAIAELDLSGEFDGIGEAFVATLVEQDHEVMREFAGSECGRAEMEGWYAKQG